MGLVACTRCTRVWPAGTRSCARCGQRMHPREPLSLQRVWAWWSLGLIAYVPANLYPMLETRTLVSTQDNTIVGGAVEIARHGSWGIAAVILTASVLIPIGKFLAVAGLALSVAHGSHVSRARRQQLYEVVEYIGRWSMIDVFVVAILSALVQLGAVVSISPGPASLFFAVSVIATMLSAQSFDSRLLWDGPDPSPAPRSRLA
ncbi:paraquat-inducible membrane protein A [Rhodovulum viride]|uniref:Paraquat-inducible membrane protein A n=1 Tax=Rhodovulum viride TaxID=1231134 RepID=A0ABX9DNX8_9RHOB|nr:paraquat-inducible protein A [Rhodovulum viride]RAP42952.1 paraquat-inducible membrane protein A [Rhodovulum viride]